jgi:hypothetical protein
MREHRIVGVHRRRRGGRTVRAPAGQPSTDLVNRQFVTDRPDALHNWVARAISGGSLWTDRRDT